MPAVFTERGLRFHFYSFEGSPREPAHAHVAKDGGYAKLWLDPDIAVANTDGLTPRELRLALEIATIRRQELIDAWNRHFAQTR